jgi:hypothetical protein
MEMMVRHPGSWEVPGKCLGVTDRNRRTLCRGPVKEGRDSPTRSPSETPKRVSFDSALKYLNQPR